MPALDIRSNLKLWLRAESEGWREDGVQISDQWESGQGDAASWFSFVPYGASATNPTFKHSTALTYDRPYPCVEFDGTDDGLNGSGNWNALVTGVYSMIALVSVETAPVTNNANTNNAAVVGSVGSQSPHLCIVTPTSSGFRFRFVLHDGTSYRSVLSDDLPLNTLHSVFVGRDSSTMYISVNDPTTLLTNTCASVIAFNTAPRIGMNWEATPKFAHCRVLAWLMWDVFLSADRRIAASDYIRSLAGLRHDDSVEQVRNVLSRRLAEKKARRYHVVSALSHEALRFMPGSRIALTHPGIPTSDGKGAVGREPYRRRETVVRSRQINLDEHVVVLEMEDLFDVGHLHYETCVPSRTQTLDVDGVAISATLTGPRYFRRRGFGYYQRPYDDLYTAAQAHFPRYESHGLTMEPKRDVWGPGNNAFIDALTSTWTTVGSVARETIPAGEPKLWDDIKIVKLGAAAPDSRLNMLRGAVGNGSCQQQVSADPMLPGRFRFWYMTRRGTAGTPASTFTYIIDNAGGGGTLRYWDEALQGWGATLVHNAIPESDEKIALLESQFIVPVTGTATNGVRIKFNSNGAGGNNSDRLFVYTVEEIKRPYWGSPQLAGNIYSPQREDEQLWLPNYPGFRKARPDRGSWMTLLRMRWSSDDWLGEDFAETPIKRIAFDADDYIEATMQASSGTAQARVRVSVSGSVSESSWTTLPTVVPGQSRLVTLRWNTDGEWGLTPKTVDLWWGTTKLISLTVAGFPSGTFVGGRVMIGHMQGVWLRRILMLARVASDDEVYTQAKTAEAF